MSCPVRLADAPYRGSTIGGFLESIPAKWSRGASVPASGTEGLVIQFPKEGRRRRLCLRHDTVIRGSSHRFGPTARTSAATTACGVAQAPGYRGGRPGYRSAATARPDPLFCPRSVGYTGKLQQLDRQ
jgi:hypothetical protein